MFAHVDLFRFEIGMVFADLSGGQLEEENRAFNSLLAILAKLEGEATDYVRNEIPGQYDTFLGATSYGLSSYLPALVSSTFSGGIVVSCSSPS